MIHLRNIDFTYQQQQVLKRFTYTFQEHGFYLLLGPSGCGKTTLLNIIAGLLTPCSGEYLFQGKTIIGKEDRESLFLNFSYITQDSYFIEYLTMEENLRLIENDIEKIREICETYDLVSKLCQYPHEISGGEKQRFSLVQAILADKRIVLLDEPTASLDNDNKHLLFSYLKDISKTRLIICVSHDLCAKEYSDHIIDFLHLNKYRTSMDDLVNGSEFVIKKQSAMYPFVAKEKRMKDKISFSLFAVIMVFCHLIFAFCIDSDNKLIDMLSQVYHYNYLSVEAPADKIASLVNYEGVKEVVYPYKYVADYAMQNIDGVATKRKSPVNAGNQAYLDSLLYETLPLGDAFPYRERLVAGHYFTKENEIILGYEKARMIQGGDHVENLIGRQLSVATPYGFEKFTIVGVFEPFSNDAIYYMMGAYESNQINDIVYFNNAYTKRYSTDSYVDNFEMDTGKQNVVLFFDSFKHTWQFYEQFHEGGETEKQAQSIYVKPIIQNYKNTLRMIENTTIILLPVAVLALLFSILFYINAHINNMNLHKQNLSIYQYHGYSWETIRKAHIRYYMLEIVKTCGMAIMLALILGNVFNFMNTKFHVLAFRPFSFDLLIISLTICVICILSCFYILISFHRMKKTNWYDLLKQRRDLL